MYIKIRPTLLFVVESVVVLSIGGYLAFRYFNYVNNLNDPITPSCLSGMSMGQYLKAAVVATGEPCAKIGSDVMKKGGNAVDAAVATMLCDTVLCPDLTGIGGGFLMTIYNKTSNSSVFINARESAPAAANPTMYADDPKKSLEGALAVAVPGFLRGIWVAYNLYGGGVSWESLIEPTISLCEKGVVVSKRLARSINVAKELPLNAALNEYFVNNQTNNLMKEGDIYTMSKLATVLKIVAKEGANAIYDGSLTTEFVNDIKNAGGIITAEDLTNYSVQIEESFEITLKNGYKLYSGLPSGSGIILAYILRLLDGRLPAPDPGLDAHRLVEAYKFAYGERTRLGDHMFVNASRILEKVKSDDYINSIQNKISDQYTSSDPKYYGAYFEGTTDHGTANIVVLDSEGSAVSVTSTLNTVFGSGYVSPSTGIILNNEMDDFSTPNASNLYGFPPSPFNFIQPYKRPMSSMCPTVITDSKGDVVLVIGGAGGSKITLATAYVSALVLWYNKTLKAAIDEPRLYHQLIPMEIDYEYGVLKTVVEKLKEIGHPIAKIKNKNKSAVSAIYKTPDGLITAMADFRQPGNVSGY